MELDQICPTCGVVHRANIKFEWNRELDKDGKPTGRMHLLLRMTSQSVKVDGGRIEGLAPYSDDGCELVIEPKWVKDGVLDLDIYRKPRIGAPKPVTMDKTLADLQTEAAEAGMKVDKKMTREQLAVALQKHKDSQE